MLFHQNTQLFFLVYYYDACTKILILFGEDLGATPNGEPGAYSWFRDHSVELGGLHGMLEIEPKHFTHCMISLVHTLLNEQKEN